MEISIGMKREKLVEFANEILANCLKSEGHGSKGGVDTVTLFGTYGSNEVAVTFDNEDMERPEVDADTVCVEVN